MWGASAHEQREQCGWWALHTALAFHAPEAFLQELRKHTPVDAFGNPARPNPGRKGAVKCNGADIRQRRRNGGARARQLRFLCEGARGAPPDLQWSNKNEWGMVADGRFRLQVVDLRPRDPSGSAENVGSLETNR